MAWKLKAYWFSVRETCACFHGFGNGQPRVLNALGIFVVIKEFKGSLRKSLKGEESSFFKNQGVLRLENLLYLVQSCPDPLSLYVVSFTLLHADFHPIL